MKRAITIILLIQLTSSLIAQKHANFLAVGNYGLDFKGGQSEDILEGIAYLNTSLITDKKEPNSQSDRWVRLNPKTSIATGFDITFVDDNNGFIVNGSELLMTKDQGENWETIMKLNGGVKTTFIDDYGYIIGNTGTVYKSTDKGEGWSKLETTLSDRLNGITLLEKNTVFVTGDHTLYKSFDGGISWEEFDVQNVDVKGSYFINENVGHLACRGLTILKTIDGGETWYETNSSSSGIEFLKITFVNEEIGYATTNSNDVFKTTNGGESWSEIASLDSGLSIQFLNENIGFVAGAYGSMYKTEDGGDTWVRIGFDGNIYRNDFYAVHFIDEYIGFATGAGGRIMRTFDGGNLWESYSFTHSPIYDIELESDETIFVLAYNNIIKSSNNGAEWTSLGSVAINEKTKKIDFVNKDIGFAIAGGDLGTSASSNHVFKTMDGGLTWSRQNVGEIEYASGGLGAIKFFDENIGIVSGSRGQIYKSIDSGLSWTEVTHLEYNQIGEFEFTDQVGYAINSIYYSGRLFKTIDGGENWNLAFEADIVDDINAMHFINSEVGYLVGDSGLKMKKTKDGGLTWETIDIPHAYYTDVYFYTEYYGLICTHYGYVYETFDGGQNWNRLYELSGIKKISGNGNEIFVYGDYGSILKSNITLTNKLSFSHGGSSIILDEATVDVNVLSSIDDVTVSLEVWTSESVTKEIEYGIVNAGSTHLEVLLSDLESYTAYNYCFKAEQGDEIVYSDTLSLVTSSVDVMFSSGEASIDVNKATIYNEFLSNIDNVEISLAVWTPESNIEVIEYGIVNEGSTNLEVLLSNLEENTLYYCQFRAKHDSWTISSETIKFTTPLINMMFTSEGAFVDLDKATIYSDFSSNTDDLLVSLDVWTSESNLVDVEFGKVEKGSTYVEVLLPNLKESTTYNCRFKSEYKDKITYSDTIRFTTQSILAADSKRRIVIYPNPAEDYLIIKGFENLVESVLINLSGGLVKKNTTNPSLMDLSDLEPGIYILQFHGENFQDSKQVIIH